MTITANYERSLDGRINCINEAMGPCGELIMEALSSPVDVKHKGRVDIVTATDLAVENLLITTIQKHFPTDDILAEESGSRVEGSEYLWVIDPIDGTTNFGNRLPHFCISVALQNGDALVYAVIYDPCKNMRFTAQKGFGAFLNDKPICVSGTESLVNALLATGFSYDRHTRKDNNVAEFNHLLRRCRGLRRMGSAALDLAYVAAGWLDGYWEYRLKPWDVAAGCLIVEEAGGRVTRLDGGAYSIHDEHFCVANPNLHPKLLASVAEAPKFIGSVEVR